MLGTYYAICESIIEIRLAISLRYGFGQMESQSMENGPFFRVFFYHDMVKMGICTFCKNVLSATFEI